MRGGVILTLQVNQITSGVWLRPPEPKPTGNSSLRSLVYVSASVTLI